MEVTEEERLAIKMLKKIYDKNNPNQYKVMHPTRGEVENLYYESQNGKRFCQMAAFNNALGGSYITYELFNPFVEQWINELFPGWPQNEKLRLKIKHGWNPAYNEPPGYEMGEKDIVSLDLTGETTVEVKSEQKTKRLYHAISYVAAQAFLKKTYNIEMRRVIALEDAVGYQYMLGTAANANGVGHAIAYRNGFILDSNLQPKNYTLVEGLALRHTLPTTSFDKVVNYQGTHYPGLRTNYGEVEEAIQLIFAKHGEVIPDVVDDFGGHVKAEFYGYGRFISLKAELIKQLPKPFIRHKDAFIINEKGEKHYMEGSYVSPAVANYFNKRNASLSHLDNFEVITIPSKSGSSASTFPSMYNLVPRKKNINSKATEQNNALLNLPSLSDTEEEEEKTIKEIFGSSDEDEPEWLKDESTNEGVMTIPKKKTNNIDYGEDPFWDDYFAEEEKEPPKKKIKVTFINQKKRK
jgi:hypothetical protein